MTLEAVRKLLMRQCKPYTGHKGFGLRGWCAAHNVVPTHASEFLSGKRLPANDVLDALGLEWRVMRKRA